MAKQEYLNLIIHYQKLISMLYQLNRDLSLEEKGLMALMLYLQAGGFKLTPETLEHYCPNPSHETILMLAHLRQFGYLNVIGKGERITVVEDNEIKE
jgi:hypothetical protein